MEGEKALKQYEDFTDKEKLFVKYYPMRLNATWAAFKAGYSKSSARQIGSETLSKPYIRAYIDQQLRAMQLGPDDIKKSFSDIAKTSLNEFFNIKKVEHIPRIEIPLSEHVAKLREELDFEDEYAARAGLEPEEMLAHYAAYKQMELKILRLEMKLEKNPDATIIVGGPSEWIEVAELDMVKLVKAREKGRIKSISYTANGPKVEMYAADAALRDLARMHGLFIDKVEATGKDGAPIVFYLPDNGRTNAGD